MPSLTSPALRERPYRTAAAFLERLRGSKWPARELTTSWIFRGQGRAQSWSLLPSAYRTDRRSEQQAILHGGYARAEREARRGWMRWRDLATPPPGFSADRWRRYVEVAAPEAFTHAFIVRRFVLLADRAKQRIRVPLPLWHLPNPDYPYLAQFLRGRLGGGHAGGVDERVLGPVFSIAQHHGVPTPLLDWTYNPLVAAYFAAEQSLTSRSREPLAVWALSEDYLNHPAARLERMTVEPQVTSFLDAQEGLFTWHPDAYRSMKRGRFTPFETVVQEDLVQIRPRRALLWKLTLPAEEAGKLFTLLWHERVGRAYLMPGFDGVTKSLELQSRWGSAGLDDA